MSLIVCGTGIYAIILNKASGNFVNKHGNYIDIKDILYYPVVKVSTSRFNSCGKDVDYKWFASHAKLPF